MQASHNIGSWGGGCSATGAAAVEVGSICSIVMAAGAYRHMAWAVLTAAQASAVVGAGAAVVAAMAAAVLTRGGPAPTAAGLALVRQQRDPAAVSLFDSPAAAAADSEGCRGWKPMHHFSSCACSHSFVMSAAASGSSSSSNSSCGSSGGYCIGGQCIWCTCPNSSSSDTASADCAAVSLMSVMLQQRRQR